MTTLGIFPFITQILCNWGWVKCTNLVIIFHAIQGSHSTCFVSKEQFFDMWVSSYDNKYYLGYISPLLSPLLQSAISVAKVLSGAHNLLKAALPTRGNT